MTLNLNVPQTVEQITPRITVIGVGGAGGNAVNNMIQNNLEGVEFLVTNTDSQALAQTLAERTIQLGRNVTQGLGAGSRPDIGRAAAEEVLDDLMNELDSSNMIFVTAGMGGGTGTGAAPVIARAAREAGILTVGVVTKPFHFEGVHRMRIAETGIQELQQFVDTLIIIPNQNLFRVANEKTTFADAFKMADDVLDSGVRGVTDLMIMPGLINLDFADIRAVMSEMGKAMMGTGEAESDNRAVEAAEAAISNPLLDDVSMKGARGVLINITGGSDMTLFEVDEAANRIRDEVDAEANIIFGSTFVQSMEGRMRVSVVATGIDADQIEAPRPMTLSLVSEQPAARAAAGSVGAASGLAAAPIQASDTVEDHASLQAAAIETPALDYEDPQAASRPTGENDYFGSEGQASGTAEFDQRIRSEAAAVAPGHDESEFRGAADREDGFVAPPPVESEVRNPLYNQPSVRREPTAETQPTRDHPNGGGQGGRGTMGIGRKKARSFLARVSGAARALQNVTQSAEPGAISQQEPRPHAEARPATPATPVMTRHDPAEPTHQPRLAGLDPAERTSASTPDDELLDIPAFLRRQAN